MIHEVTGDILRTQAAVIAHGVAPNDHFNSGLALQLRERFPGLFKDFRRCGQMEHPKSGDLWVWSGLSAQGPVHIACLFTQDGGYLHGSRPGRASIDHVNHALRKLVKWSNAHKPSSIALPRLATGLGALPWERVLPLIRQHLGELETPVFVYTTYVKGVAAKEPAPLVHA